jgi:hypothetical protein
MRVHASHALIAAQSQGTLLSPLQLHHAKKTAAAGQPLLLKVTQHAALLLPLLLLPPPLLLQLFLCGKIWNSDMRQT